MHLVDIDRKDPRTLGGINDEEQTVFFRDLSYRFDIDHVSGQIGSMGTDDSSGFSSNLFFKIRDPNSPPFVARHKGKTDSLFFHLIKRAQHRIVLQLRRNDVISRKKRSLDRQIQALRGIAGKSNSPGIGSMEKLRQFHPCVEDGSGCSQRSGMNSSAGISHLLHGFCDRCNDLRRLVHCGCCIIKVNHIRTYSSHFPLHRPP